MSECVVRMEMPKDCFECPFGIIDGTEDGVWCTALAQQSSGQREDCPIICSLPEGHGRLGDLDALADDVRSLWDYKTVDGITATTVLNHTLTDIWNCPTIVPAEAERAET